jgi:hypothetical protein
VEVPEDQGKEAEEAESEEKKKGGEERRSSGRATRETGTDGQSTTDRRWRLWRSSRAKLEVKRPGATTKALRRVLLQKSPVFGAAKERYAD